MANKVVCIDIGQDRTKICEVEYRKKNPKVYNSTSFQTPEDVIVDGAIKDIRALATVLKEKLEQMRIKNNNVIFTISSTKIANREVVIPFVKDNRIQEVVMANASDYFPIDIENYNITYLVLKKVETEDVKEIRLLVLAAPSSLIKSYYELATMLKLNITAIDYVGNSSFQMLKNEESDNVEMVIQINEGNTIIHLLEENCLLLQRTLPYGTDAVAQSVISNRVFQVEDYEEAMDMLKNGEIINTQFTTEEEDYSIFTSSSEEVNHQFVLERAKEDVTSSLKVLTANINRVIDYFMTKHPGKKISKIQITGNGVGINNLTSLIQNEIGITTQPLTTLTNVTFVHEVGSGQIEYISCIGAAIAPLDFVPKEVLIKEAGERNLMFPLIMFGACTIGAFAIFLSSYLLYRKSVSEQTKLEEKIIEIKDIEKIYNDYKKSESELNGIHNIHKQTENKSEHMLTFLAELEGKTPKGCKVMSMQLDNGDLTMQVTAEDKTLAAKYIQNLKTCSLVDSVSSTGYISNSEATNASNVTFAVVCTLQEGGK